MADNVPITAGSGTDIATDDVGGVQYQRVKNVWGADGVATDVSATNPMPVVAQSKAAATGTITSPSIAATTTTALASNTARLGATFYNDSTGIIYIALAATASATAFTVKLYPGDYYELPGSNVVFTGLVSAIATVAASALRVTELTA